MRKMLRHSLANSPGQGRVREVRSGHTLISSGDKNHINFGYHQTFVAFGRNALPHKVT